MISSEYGLQHESNAFCSYMKHENQHFHRILHPLRNPVGCSLQNGGISLKPSEKFIYLGDTFTSDGKQDKELDVKLGKASAVMRALHY